MTFDKAVYDETLDEIETLLGYLKGNELLFKYLNAVKARIDTTERPYQIVEGDYTTPCPDPAFAFQPKYPVPVREGGSTQIDFDIEAKIFAGADAAWKQGKTWAGGVAGQARAITEQITSPDVAELEAALESLRTEVLLPLELLIDSHADLPEPVQLVLGEGENSVDGDWAKLGGSLDTWRGDAADEFRTLYDSLGTRIAINAYQAGTVTLRTAAATAIIGSAQEGLMISVKDIKSILLEQLKKWCAVRAPFTDGSKAPLWILDLLPIWKVFKAARFAFKLIDEVVEAGRKFTPDEIRQMVSKLADIKDASTKYHRNAAKKMVKKEEEPFKAVYADEVLEKITTMLRDTYLHDFVETLSDLAPES